MGVRRRILLPIVVALLGSGSIVALQQRASQSRQAELQLSVVKIDVAALQTAPYKASRATGGSPALAARLLRTGEARIVSTLDVLRRSNPPTALIRSQAAVTANYTTLNRIFRVGVSPTGYGSETDRLSGVAARDQSTAAALLDAAGRAYGHRARLADDEAAGGGIAALLLLLAAFGLLSRQNQRLLDASRHDALVDALTGLRNRRAFETDLAVSYAVARRERPLLLGLFDLDGFKLYNDTFGHPAGDALLARLGERLRLNLPVGATAYRIGGDEFCLLAHIAPAGADELVTKTTALMTETDATFTVSCSFGSALIPAEANSAEEALRLADRRMYVQKSITVPTGRHLTGDLAGVPGGRSIGLQSRLYRQPRSRS
jgi:diguanylate cyclase (GGDEF)-like protein